MSGGFFGVPFALFPRSASRPWRITFDTPWLESSFSNATFEHRRLIFRQTLVLLSVIFSIWLAFASDNQGVDHWHRLWPLFAIILAIFVTIFGTTFFPRLFNKPVFLYYAIAVGLVTSLAFIVPFASSSSSSMTAASVFSIYAIATFLLFTLLSIPLAFALAISVALTCITEIIFNVSWRFTRPTYIVARLLTYLALLLISIYFHMVYNCRLRSSFWNVAQTLQTQKTMEPENKLRHEMVQKLTLSIVPKELAETKMIRSTGSQNVDFQPFQNLHVKLYRNVSIVFADICGFTKMSSNKSAFEIVYLLDELFGSFDRICAATGCENISTLGDCWYGVSGCPTPRQNHAHCCVEMGLGMCRAIRKFVEKHGVNNVNMRVGIHSGNVFGGVVGTKRYKFDIWSNDATVANQMESSGEAGRVHISNDTYLLVKNDYETELGEEINDIRKPRETEENGEVKQRPRKIEKKLQTHFIVRRRQPYRHQKLTDDDEIPDGNQSSRQSVIERADQANLLTGLARDSEQVERQVLPEGLCPNDQQLFKIINYEMQDSNTFTRPPIGTVRLRFTNVYMEKDYVLHTGDPTPPEDIYLASQGLHKKPGEMTYLANTAPTHLASYLVTLGVVFLVLAACFTAFVIRPYFIAASIIGIVFIVVPIFLGLPTFSFASKGQFIFIFVASFIALEPAMFTLADFSCDILTERDGPTIYLMIFIVSILHLTLFAHVPYMIRACLGTAATIVMCILLAKFPCNIRFYLPAFLLNNQGENLIANASVNGYQNGTRMEPHIGGTSMLYSQTDFFLSENIIAMATVLLLIWLAARESEFAARLAWYSAAENCMVKFSILEEQTAAEDLISNIIPPRIISEAFNQQCQQKLVFYSEKHQNCGVIFASIKNFHELYEESFEGGQGYLRVLNDLLVEFESLLDQPLYKDIEKIKTIGPCLMCASGLDNERRHVNKDPNAHLYALMDYCFSLIDTVNTYNEKNLNISSLKFQLAIGFNAGEVVSGVIGSSKFHYDIWGDTVNVASRMYSTGMGGRIQVPEEVANLLSNKFKFEPRGAIALKGKNDMKTCFVAGLRAGATWS